MLPFYYLVVIQIHGKEPNTFQKNWSSYSVGFGGIEDEEFWLGLEKVHQITTSEKVSLDIELTGKNYYTDYVQKTITLTWKTFEISNEADGYRLKIGDFQNNGNARALDKLNYHNGMMFSTLDRDNDQCTCNCSSYYYGGGGWWFKSCSHSMLNHGNGNGPYYQFYFDQSKMILKGKPNKKLGVIFKS